MFNLNFWCYALKWKWATVEQVKMAITFNDVTKEDLEKGLAVGIVTQEQFDAIVPPSAEIADTTAEQAEEVPVTDEQLTTQEQQTNAE
ncbi:hypothetical protein [Niallia sp. 03190]|uniref:hypothetical protein n=1 Tax=Niallia sp. 03190 TaxID=3458061 RepID=UPI00404507F9